MNWSKIAAGVLILTSCASRTRSDATEIGCYAATPALTYSGTGIPERGDSSFSLLQLMRGGRAERPVVPQGPMPYGTWRVAADTLHVVVANGFSGWLLHVRSDRGGWVGKATYTSDAFVVGAPPYHHEIQLRPRACVGSG